MANTNFKEPVNDFYTTNTASYEQLRQSLKQHQVVQFSWTFDIAAAVYKLPDNYQSGLFQIPKNSSNREIILLLSRTPKKNVVIEIRPFRKRSNLLAHFCKKLDINHTILCDALKDTNLLKELGDEFTTENIYTVFIQDTLHVYKNAQAKDISHQLVRNYRRFWTSNHMEKAQKMKLSCEEVCILASIVEAETKHREEMPRIAGLYLNRLKTNKKLQADPTIVYALGKSVRRVKKQHTKINSRYNTYRYKGLPPGPVFIPSTHAIEAVLNYEKHDYFFFCAKPNNSGYHTFTKTYHEHMAVSRKYHQHLNKRQVK